jgi:hypothetical protein
MSRLPLQIVMSAKISARTDILRSAIRLSRRAQLYRVQARFIAVAARENAARTRVGTRQRSTKSSSFGSLRADRDGSPQVKGIFASFSRSADSCPR